MFISKSELAMEKELANTRGYALGHIEGFKKGYKRGREENPFKNCPPNGIRKMFGLSPIKDGLNIVFSAVDEIHGDKDPVKNDNGSIDRGKYIEALEAVCTDCNGCENCPIGRIEHNQKYCVIHDWDEMDNYALKTLANAAGVVFEEDAEDVEDPVNRPSHYTAGGIECIDAIAASMTPTEYTGFLKGQVLKYVWRYRLKGKPAEDLKKARFYLDRLIQITEKEEVAV